MQILLLITVKKKTELCKKCVERLFLDVTGVQDDQGYKIEQDRFKTIVFMVCSRGMLQLGGLVPVQ